MTIAHAFQQQFEVLSGVSVRRVRELGSIALNYRQHEGASLYIA
jgi:hypothetical protein